MRIKQLFLFSLPHFRSDNFKWISEKLLLFLHELNWVILTIIFFLNTNCSEPETSEFDSDLYHSGILKGYVRDERGIPLKSAIVRVQATEKYVSTDDSGRFVLSDLRITDSIKITAWAKGYYIGGGKSYWPGTDEILLELHALHTNDNPDYQWVSAYATKDEPGNCQNCHAEPGNPGSSMPFDEWQRDAHGQSAQNIRFLTMYLGTDVEGNKSPNTIYGYNRDYGNFPLPPNLDSTYYGPGYKLDFVNASGNCGACHTPVAAMNTPYGVDPSKLTGVGMEGVACDFCHKVWDVKLSPATNLPYKNMPGVLSYEMRRPPEGHQFFAGPLDDVAPGEDTYTAIQKQSKFCAPCHNSGFWDVEIYSSYKEWLESPYSNPQSGQTCQDCHMPSGLTNHFALTDKGGLQRDPTTIASHRMLGISDPDFMQNALTMNSSAVRQDTEIVVHVDICNDRTGHHIPTDSPLRHLILFIEAVDENGNTLEQKKGSVLPDWCGIGNPDMGYYAGLPGKTYAKVLEELWTGVTPTGAYWNMTRLVSDTRIPALASDQTTYTFLAPTDANVTIYTQLIYRRAYIQLMDWKGWNSPDIVMAQARHTVE